MRSSSSGGPLGDDLLEQLLLPRLDVLEAFAVGDVAGDGDLLAGIRVGANVPLQPPIGAVLMPVAVLESDQLLAPRCTAWPERDFSWSSGWMKSKIDRPSALFERIAEQP